jgi:hypothetical protein
MPQEFGWREGLPTMVTVRYKPSDDLYELWPDDSNFAFMGFDNSWWYGHNTEILRPERLPQGVVKDYAHRKLLFLIEWMFKTFPGVDRERFGCDGSSMGGTGALCFAIRHPDIFSSVNPHVPAADVARLPNAKHSFEVLFGPLGSDIRTGTGTLVWDELNNVRYIEQTRRNLPFVRLRHGRYDTWMLWEHTVRLYQALEKNRHGYIAWWAPAGHSVGVYTIPLFDKHPSNQWRIHESFIAVSDCSNNEKPGNGDPGDGDGYGGANLYLEWNVLADTADTYQARIRSLRGPVTVTITPRRCQRFLPQPGETLTYQVAGTLNRAGEVTVDADGLFSLEKLGPVPAGAWVTVTWKPK